MTWSNDCNTDAVLRGKNCSRIAFSKRGSCIVCYTTVDKKYKIFLFLYLLFLVNHFFKSIISFNTD